MKKEIKMNFDGITIEKGFELWIENCKRRGLTKPTIEFYNAVSNIFMDNIGYKTKITDVNSKLVDTFILKLQDKNVKTISINTYLNGIRAICNWWAREEYISTFKIDKIKCDEVVKDTFSNADILVLLRRPILKNCTFLEFESFVLCNVFYGLGARSSTICNLKISDLNLQSGFILYSKMKNRKQAIIPLGNTLVAILKEFLSFRKGSDEDYIFVNAHGGKLDRARLYKIMKRYYLSRNVTRTGIHIWRHSFSRDYIRAGGNALKLQAQLCHSTLEMTRKYVNLYGDDMRDNINNPLELLNSKKAMLNMKKGGK